MRSSILGGLLGEKPARLGLDDRDHIHGFDEVFVFCIFYRCQRSRVSLLSEFLDAGLKRGGGAEHQKCCGDLLSQDVRQRF